MPSSLGPNTISDSSIVFNYDTGDAANSYKGEPTTNLTPYSQDFSSWGGNLFGNWINSNITLNASIAPDGTLTGNRFGNGYSRYTNSIVATTSTVYTFSVWLRNVSLTGDGVSLWWSFGLNGGLVSYGNGLSVGLGTLTSQWQRFSFSVTSNSSGINQLQFGIVSFTGYGGNGSGQQFDAWGAQVEQKSYATPYIPTTTSALSRSNTQGLLDISGTGKSISLSNVSFTSGQITFDGTDDFITLGSDVNFKTTGGWTVESVVYYNSVAGNYNNVTSPANFIGSEDINYNSWYWSVLENKLALWNISPGYWRYGSTTLQPNTWYHVALVSFDGGGKYQFYLNGVAEGGDHVSEVWNSSYSGLRIRYIGKGNNANTRLVNGKIPITKVYDRALTSSEILNNYTEYRKRFDLPVYTYSEGSNATPYLSNWNNSTTYTMADFGGIRNVTAHGWSTGPATYTLTLNNLPPHTKVRYKVFWHLVDSLDNETNQLFIMNSSGGETEILRFTKQYNLTPAISIAASPGTYTWSGAKSYTYRPWAGGAYGADGYIIVDSGLVDHTSTTFTARHVMGADQAQADEAEYLSHVIVELYN
jgi:hypothetical protein